MNDTAKGAPVPTGALEDDGRALVLRRRLEAPVDEVWRWVTVSERLERWFGTWTGDPRSGSVQVTMNAEAGELPPATYSIIACEAPRHLTVKAVDEIGAWQISVELAPAAGDAADGEATELAFRHDDVDPAMVASIGPGWEWYLDRLEAAMSGGALPGLEDFEAVHMTMSEAYAALAAR